MKTQNIIIIYVWKKLIVEILRNFNFNFMLIQSSKQDIFISIVRSILIYKHTDIVLRRITKIVFRFWKFQYICAVSLDTHRFNLVIPQICNRSI